MKIIVFFLSLCLYLVSATQAFAAQWTKLNENTQSKLMLDKQSVIEKDQLKKAWLKIEYKTPQKNLQEPDKTFNLAKVLWYFDCPAQKSATSQVVQYLNDEMVFSAGIDAKKAEFIEPVPETDVDIAMRYVCTENKPVKKEAETKVAGDNKVTDKAKDATKATEPPKEEGKDKAETKSKEESKSEAKKEPLTKDAANKEKNDVKLADKTKPATPSDPKKVHWTYEGKEGPEQWGKLNPEFALCETGKNQSPINVDETIDAPLKKIRGIQKFPAKDIFNNGHTVQVNFTQGNMLVLDNAPYQMKQVHFHSPSENSIHNKTFPLEAHFVHADAKGNLTVIGVMFKEGKANSALDKLWEQMPNEVSEPVALKSRVIASDLMPENRDYYRFSGSLTTPPCSEGVRWILLKTTMTASKEQIEKFSKAVKHTNNRPIQGLNGRVVLE